MSDDDMIIDRDREAGTWDIDAVPLGPAGGARLQLSRDLEIIIDIARPERLAVSVAEDFGTGRVSDADLARLDVLVGGPIATQVAGYDRGTSGPAEGQRELLTRLALAVDGREQARSIWARNIWSAEIAGIAATADSRLQLADLVAEHRVHASEGLRSLTQDQRIALDADGRRALQDLSETIGGVSNDVQPADRSAEDPRTPVVRELWLDRAAVARPQFDAEARHRLLTGWLMLDPRSASLRVFDVERPAQLEWDAVDHVLRVQCALSPRAYLPEVESNWVRVYRARTQTLLSLCPLDPFAGGEQQAEAELFLGPVADGDWTSIAVDVTADPETAPPTFERRTADASAAFGRLAVTAERLSIPGVAADAWSRSESGWRELGDADRAEQAAAAPERDRLDQPPFSAELVISELGSLRP